MPARSATIMTVCTKRGQDSSVRAVSPYSLRSIQESCPLFVQAVTVLVVLAASLVCPASAPAAVIGVSSPNRLTRIEFLLERHDKTEEIPHYRAYYKDQLIVLDSRLALSSADGPPLGGPCVVESVQTTSHQGTYSMFPGKRRQVVDHYTEAVIAVREQTPPGRRWELVMRAYDDGVAFRYRFPAQKEWPRLLIAAERTEFALPMDARAFALPLNSFTTSYEKRYEKKAVADIPGNWLLGLPLLIECPGRGWAAITEANLTDYAGMYLARPDAQGTVLTSRLSPLPGRPKLAVQAALPHVSPWRVVMLGDEPARLLESDLLLNLNEPCAIADPSWIQPGKTTFPWWNGYYEENVPFKPGLNTATMKYYVDFCAASRIPFHSLDGLDNTAWYSGPIVPYKGADITRALPSIDLQEVIGYAREKKVGIRLWMHWQAARAHMDRAFPLYRQWGIHGVMLDFMDRDDQEMVNFLREVLRKAAENRLTVTLHGVSKPTGLERTYPNLLTSEGVLNLEYNKWDRLGCPPEHEVTVAFTRMLAGPLDFHQGSFRGVRPEQFRPRNSAPNIMGTPCRTLASYVVYQNHLSMVADYPSAYRDHPALPVLVQIPTAWDDTRVVSGSVGEYIVIARRQGDTWYVGAMGDRQQRRLPVSLAFLGRGRYRAEIYADDPGGSRDRELSRRMQVVT
ncbi:MAG: glycoside hydrolase family 97 protein, partial [Planctomycetota bacterium]